MTLILEAEDHILGLDNGKERYIAEVTALSKAFAIALPHEEVMDVKDEVAFFQAVKARLIKFTGDGSGRSPEEIETNIRQVIDKALVSEQVIDIFDAGGIKKPDVSILSEEFLMELKAMKQKNVALEVLKKLLQDEIRSRSKVNLVQSRKLKEMLEDALKRYHNKAITSAEVIEHLMDASRWVAGKDKEPEQLGLSTQEYAFYLAVAENESAKELMDNKVLLELAIIITEQVRKNATIDWTIRESVQAKLRVAV